MMDANFIGGMYRSSGAAFVGVGGDIHVNDRAYLLREVAQCLRRHEVSRALRKEIVLDIANVFLIELSEHGIDHFLGE